MKWRFVDRIEGCEPWISIHGRKVVSFEEYSLLKPFGRKGTLPEALVMESLIQLARWLIVNSSDSEQVGIVSQIDDLRFGCAALMGDSLGLSIRVLERGDKQISMACEASTGSGIVCQGTIALDVFPLAGYVEPESLRSLWGELNAPA